MAVSEPSVARITQSLTQRGAICLIDENNFCYNKNNQNKTGAEHVFWICAKPKCNARIKTNTDLELVGDLPDHLHIGNNMLKRKVR